MMMTMIALAGALIFGLFWSRPGFTAPFIDAAGRTLPGSIAALERVTLGGVDQGMLIRGLNTSNPVLLFLHGGPGTSELGMVRLHNMAALEKHFTVVVWDQRGAGLSFAVRKPNQE